MEKDRQRKLTMHSWAYLQKEMNTLYPKPVCEACKPWEVQSSHQQNQQLHWVKKTGRVSPRWNNRTCRTPCGVLPHPASPGEPLAVKPQDSLTNTEERLMCHGMSAKLSLPCAKPFSAKPEPAMVMEISPFLSLSSKNAISTALQKWSSQLWTIHGFPRRKSYSLMTSLVSWAH